MSEADDPHLLGIWLPALQRWHEQTGNPLYVWQALARCLNATPPAQIPDWCIPYLAKAANNIALLSWGKDFRDDSLARTATPDEAKTLTGEALNLWRAKSKTAFAKAADDAQAARAAMDYDDAAERTARGRMILYMKNGQAGEPPQPADVRNQFKQQTNVDDDRAGRVLRRGRQLYRGKQG